MSSPSCPHLSHFGSLSRRPQRRRSRGSRGGHRFEATAAPTWGGFYLGAHVGILLSTVASPLWTTASLFRQRQRTPCRPLRRIRATIGPRHRRRRGRLVGQFQGDSNLFTVRGRLGYDFGRMMIYGTAGWGRESFSVPTSAIVTRREHVGACGWRWYRGVAHAQAQFAWRVSLFRPSKLQMNFSEVYPTGTGLLEVDYDRSIVRAGLTYHFN